MQSSVTNVDLSVIIKGGTSNEAAEFVHEGRTFVEGRAGSAYALRVKNRNPFRVKTVISVDGVSVISGKPVSEASDETGYILSAHESLTIEGYRLDDDSVAAFIFIKAEQGYAQADKGLTGTTGVIGCRVFKEKVATPVPTFREVHHYHYDNWPYWNRPYWGGYWYGTSSTSLTIACSGYNPSTTVYGSSTCSVGNVTNTIYNCSLGTSATQQGASNQVMCCATNVSNAVSKSAALDANPFELGSTFGAKTESRVTAVSFAVDCCLGVVELFYSTRAGLIALGIDLVKKPKVAFPTAFSGHYCQPPKGWVA